MEPNQRAGEITSWPKESQRHAMSARKISTAGIKWGKPTKSKEELRKETKERWEREEKIREQTQERVLRQTKENLKRFHPDWFIDSLEFFKFTKISDRIDKEKFMKLSTKNRKERLQESFGQEVIFLAWAGHEGALIKSGKLISIENGDVILEVNGKQVKTKDFNIKYVRRKEAKKEKKKRKVDIPKSELDFKLQTDTYKDETYTAQFDFKGCPVIANVRMHYHTIRKYWSVGYDFLYQGDREDFMYGTPYIAGEDYIESRKDARKLAMEYIKNASEKDLYKLSEFYRDRILECKKVGK